MQVSSLTYVTVLLITLFNLVPGIHHNFQQSTVGDKSRPAIFSVEELAAHATMPSTQTTTPFSSVEGGFRITLPAEYPAYRRKVEAQPTAVGDITVTTYSSESPRGACVAAYSDYPAVTFEGRSTQKILEDGRDGALKGANGTLEKQKNITIQGHPGLSVHGSVKSGNAHVYFRFDYLLVRPRLYQIGYLGYNRAELDKQETLDYFKSFRLDR